MIVVLMVLEASSFAADVVQSANLVGMGGVGVAAPDDNAAITLNPGLMGLRPRYDFHGHFRLGPIPGNGLQPGLQWAATAMDGRTSDVIAAGFSYSGDLFEPPLSNSDLPAWAVTPDGPDDPIRNRKRYHDFAAAVAFPLLDRKLSLGVGANFTIFDNDQQGNGNQFDAHVGVGFSPIRQLTFGASLRNFLPWGRQDRPMQAQFGARAEAYDNVAFEVNVGHTWVAKTGLQVALGDLGSLSVENPSRWTVSGGVDKTVGPTRIRLGGAWIGTSRRAFATFGIGTRDTGGGGGVEYALAVPISSDLTITSLVHQISARFGAPADIQNPSRDDD